MSAADLTPIKPKFARPPLAESELEELDVLYRAAIERALKALNWYEERQKSKKRGARFLRSSALLLGALTAIIPSVIALMPEQVHGVSSVRLNPVATITGIAATSAILFDKFYGFSAAWGRFILTYQVIEQHLEQFKIGWRKKLLAIHNSGLDQTAEILQAYDYIAAFSEQLSQTIRSETEVWVRDFKEATGDSGNPAVTASSSGKAG